MDGARRRNGRLADAAVADAAVADEETQFRRGLADTAKEHRYSAQRMSDSVINFTWRALQGAHRVPRRVGRPCVRDTCRAESRRYDRATLLTQEWKADKVYC